MEAVERPARQMLCAGVKLWPWWSQFLFPEPIMAGTITELKVQQSNRQRVSVYLDGDYAFGLPDIVAAKLRIGQPLSDDAIAQLQGQDTVERAYQRTLLLLGRRARSTAEVRRYLERLELAPEAVASVLDRLAGHGYLDDLQFAQAWVSNRERFKPRSAAALRSELRQKGVSQEIIAQVLSEIDHEESAYRAGQAYARRLHALDERSFRQKLGNHLLRRGFAHDVVWNVVERIWREHLSDETNDDSFDWH